MIRLIMAWFVIFDNPKTCIDMTITTLRKCAITIAGCRIGNIAWFERTHRGLAFLTKMVIYYVVPTKFSGFAIITTAVARFFIPIVTDLSWI